MYKYRSQLFLLVLVLCSSVSMGQTNIGLFGGLNMSKLSGDAPAEAFYNTAIGGNFGAFIDTRVAEGVFLSFQPSFSQEGTKVSYNVPDFGEPVDSVKIGLNYFSLPILLKVSTPSKRFYALSGVETAMLLSSSATIDDHKEDLDADISKWNLALHFGVGMRIPIGSTRLFVEARYTQGLVNLTDEPLNNNIIPRVKTSGFKVLTGIEIPLKRSKN